jgi:hypothetical protein
MAPSGPPVISNLGDGITYTEDAAPQPIAPAATISDADSPNFDSGTLTVGFSAGGSPEDRLAIRNASLVTTNGNGEVFYLGTLIGAYTGGVGATPLVVTFNAQATPESATAVLQHIVYHAESQNPSATDRTVSIQVTDGRGGTSAAVTKLIFVRPIADNPLINNFGGAITYTEDAPAMPIAPAATISDIDSAVLDTGKLTVRFSSGGRPEDRLLIRNTSVITTNAGGEVFYQGIAIGTFTGGIGTIPLVVTFNAQATPGRAAAVLRHIVYFAASQNPAVNDRTLWARVTDGRGGASVPVTKLLTVARVNDNPLLGPIAGAEVDYTRGAAAVLLPTATVTDVDSANVAGGKLIVRAIAGGHASNRLVIGGTLFTLSGNELYRSGVLVGIRNSRGGIGTTPLEITFTANATPAIAQQLIRALRFGTEGSSPTRQRTFEFSLTDGDGGLSNKVNVAVNVR